VSRLARKNEQSILLSALFRSIRIERDYSGGELCQFHPTFPLELEGRVSKDNDMKCIGKDGIQY